MRIEFHSIRFKNFLSVGDQFETFNLQKSPFTVIVGKNGTGKSTILDALTYVLFKKPFRKINLNQLVNVYNKKNMLVEIAFTAGKHSYVIRRGEKPKVFEIYKDKKLIEPDSLSGDMQDYLENQILSQNYKVFTQINVIGKATYTPFMMLEAKDRRIVVENILDSLIYSVMQNIAKDDLKGIKVTQQEYLSELKIQENTLSNLEAMLKKYNEDRSQEISDCELFIKENNEKVAELTVQLSEYKENGSAAIQEKATILPDEEKFKQILQKLTSEQAVLRSEISKNQNIIDKIDALDVCPHCMQNVGDEHKEEILKEAKRIVASNSEKLAILKEKQAKIDEIQRKISEIDSKINDFKYKYIETNNKIESIQSQEKSILARLEKLREPLVLPDNMSNPDEIKNKIKDLTDKNDKSVKDIDKYNKAIKLLGDDGIKASLIEKYIGIINTIVNDYLDKMELFVDFELDSQFNETIKSNYLEQFSYQSFSEGQKMRIELAILLAWRKIAQMRNSMTTNILFLDEIADGSLDTDGMKEFMNILKSTLDAQHVFVISHKESTIDMFDQVIKVDKVGNFTKYIYE